jgi:hypothetical protein
MHNYPDIASLGNVKWNPCEFIPLIVENNIVWRKKTMCFLHNGVVMNYGRGQCWPPLIEGRSPRYAHLVNIPFKFSSQFTHDSVERKKKLLDSTAGF